MALAFFGREDFRYEMFFAHAEDDSTVTNLKTV